MGHRFLHNVANASGRLDSAPLQQNVSSGLTLNSANNRRAAYAEFDERLARDAELAPELKAIVFSSMFREAENRSDDGDDPGVISKVVDAMMLKKT